MVEVLDRLMKRGVRVRVISDNDKAHDKGSDVWRLPDLGAEVRVDRSPHHMHHKFAIIDDDQFAHRQLQLDALSGGQKPREHLDHDGR